MPVLLERSETPVFVDESLPGDDLNIRAFSSLMKLELGYTAKLFFWQLWLLAGSEPGLIRRTSAKELSFMKGNARRILAELDNKGMIDIVRYRADKNIPSLNAPGDLQIFVFYPSSDRPLSKEGKRKRRRNIHQRLFSFMEDEDDPFSSSLECSNFTCDFCTLPKEEDWPVLQSVETSHEEALDRHVQNSSIPESRIFCTSCGAPVPIPVLPEEPSQKIVVPTPNKEEDLTPCAKIARENCTSMLERESALVQSTNKSNDTTLQPIEPELNVQKSCAKNAHDFRTPQAIPSFAKPQPCTSTKAKKAPGIDYTQFKSLFPDEPVRESQEAAPESTHIKDTQVRPCSLATPAAPDSSLNETTPPVQKMHPKFEEPHANNSKNHNPFNISNISNTSTPSNTSSIQNKKFKNNQIPQFEEFENLDFSKIEGIEASKRRIQLAATIIQDFAAAGVPFPQKARYIPDMVAALIVDGHLKIHGDKGWNRIRSRAKTRDAPGAYIQSVLKDWLGEGILSRYRNDAINRYHFANRTRTRQGAAGESRSNSDATSIGELFRAFPEAFSGITPKVVR